MRPCQLAWQHFDYDVSWVQKKIMYNGFGWMKQFIRNQCRNLCFLCPVGCAKSVILRRLSGFLIKIFWGTISAMMVINSNNKLWNKWYDKSNYNIKCILFYFSFLTFSYLGMKAKTTLQTCKNTFSISRCLFVCKELIVDCCWVW